MWQKGNHHEWIALLWGLENSKLTTKGINLIKLIFYGDVCLWFEVLSICCCCCQIPSVMSDSVRPHRRQPTRLPCPWDSPGKNTGVGCHCLLQCMKVRGESEVAQSCPTLSNPMDYSLPGSSIHRIFQARVLELGAIAFSIYPSRCIEFFWFWPGGSVFRPTFS